MPTLWGPLLFSCLLASFKDTGIVCTMALFALGFMAWQLMEYVIHRWIFHTIPQNYWGITAHFLFHGCHHKFPMDATRLVFPPLPAGAVALGVYGCLQAFAQQV